ncbi:hypothetical protein DSO57_1017862 [Entomophthora muscae]|uniref:Uncharacterized protein n=4 Tax=Entomophthora muscae TaxID=34485 RepID=A0ACC2STJ0_9FUNG|nr:hypothetical protein DSO57_1036039 [Entomophthora muscae]KAJ9052257.1 hypothetical protein DSO57_1036042 [Entomophthora muscae]KAJ9065594.1 hypothetical protein DSO57_1017860 [Entomophthora muscae]KAJ9065596.1 hypothetical protein DSO57_1017862 [Entomophthora muscae]
MGLYISKLSIQALAVSQVAMYCSAAPIQNMNLVDTNVQASEAIMNPPSNYLPRIDNILPGAWM